MRDETLTQIVIVFIVISGVCWAIFAGISLILFLPFEIVAGVFLVAVAAAVVAMALALFANRKQERGY
jgi:high-affinity Fe2+/Pb2+ permease